uniref:Uncharacterized protein n=1 Tax=Moniliophthora roreri TaxID=221103 RepID=A0A0W0FDP5_MONRR
MYTGDFRSLIIVHDDSFNRSFNRNLGNLDQVTSIIRDIKAGPNHGTQDTQAVIMKAINLSLLALFAGVHAAPQWGFTTNTESDAGTTTCITFTFGTPEATSTTWTGGTSDDAITLTTTITRTTTTTNPPITCSCAPNATITKTVTIPSTPVPTTTIKKMADDDMNGSTQNPSNLKLKPTVVTSQSSETTTTTPPLPKDVTFCDDVETLRTAVTDLGASRTLILDCEGRDLGTRGGALSLISIRATEPIPKTYVFDILRLDGSSLEPLWLLLLSTNKRKVVFDGRQDFCAIWYDYGVALPNTIDLQLADIRSRERRGEGEVKQMQRLMRLFSPGSINNPRQRRRYIELQLLQGLGGALIEHKVTAPAKGNVDHDSWMTRPLSKKHLFYAANDVYLIDLLLAHFEAAGYIDDELSVQSARYITIWGDFQPQRDNTFRSNPFLPLEILTYEDNAPRRPCSGCRRNLSPTAYPGDTWKFFEDLKQKKKQEKERSQNGGTVAQQVVTVGPMLSPGLPPPPPTQNRSLDHNRTGFQEKERRQNGDTVAQQVVTVGPMLSPGPPPPPTQNHSLDHNRTGFQERKKRSQEARQHDREAKERMPNASAVERPVPINPAPIYTPQDDRPIVTGNRGRVEREAAGISIQPNPSLQALWHLPHEAEGYSEVIFRQEPEDNPEVLLLDQDEAWVS